MGLITGLLTLPLAPVRGVGWVAEQVADQAEQELYDEGRIMRELAAIELAHDAGEIDDDTLAEHTDRLLERLEEGRRIREWRAMNSG
jgi:DNA-binding GntR family transcriptional regulator